MFSFLGSPLRRTAKVPDPRTVLRTGTTTVLTGQVRKAPLLYGDGQSGGPGITGAGTVPGPGGTHLPFPPPFTIQLFGNDFLGAALGPDGTPYGSFNADCGPTRTRRGAWPTAARPAASWGAWSCADSARNPAAAGDRCW